MEFEPTLSPRFVAYVRDYLMDRGVDPDPVFLESGISSTCDEDFDESLPVEQVAKLFELAAHYTNNPCMGMNMGQGYHYESSSLLILAMLAAPSVAEGIKCLNQYDQYVDTAIETRFDFDQPHAEFGARVITPENVKVNQLNEYLMVFLVQALGVATRQAVPLKEVCFEHAAGESRKELLDFFGAPIRYSQESNKLVFDRDFLRERFFSSNALLYDILTNAMKTYFASASSQNSFVDTVCREITLLTGNELPSTEIIAKRLAMSPRTLRRRLAEDGYSFQEAKNLARERRAKYYLSQTNMPLSEIAFELGYSELSAFSRAFRSWVGKTPQSYRETSRHIFGA